MRAAEEAPLQREEWSWGADSRSGKAPWPRRWSNTDTAAWRGTVAEGGLPSLDSARCGHTSCLEFFEVAFIAEDDSPFSSAGLEWISILHRLKSPLSKQEVRRPPLWGAEGWGMSSLAQGLQRRFARLFRVLSHSRHSSQSRE